MKDGETPYGKFDSSYLCFRRITYMVKYANNPLGGKLEDVKVDKWKL